MKYGFTRTFARLNVALGIAIILAGVALAAFAFFILPQTPGLSARLPHGNEVLARAAVAIIVFITGLAVGSSLIVVGQLILAFLDMHAMLRRIHRRLRESEAFRDTESRVAGD